MTRSLPSVASFVFLLFCACGGDAVRRDADDGVSVDAEPDADAEADVLPESDTAFDADTEADLAHEVDADIDADTEADLAPDVLDATVDSASDSD
ncbi:MAG: hypothetical protein JNJ59_01615, partial [Deltaproteobacteria bacterium]|nr:hypothetical protein [Deltaproteobacteria bacterium]